MVILHVTYHLLENNAKEYVDALECSGIPKLCREEEGNIKYDYYYSAANSNEVLLVELWKDPEAFETHKQFDHFKQLQVFKERYVKNAEINRYLADTLNV